MDPKDKRIKNQLHQIQELQTKLENSRKDFTKLRGMHDDMVNGILLFRSAVNRGDDIKQLFLEKSPENLMLNYEINLYKSLVIRLKKRNFLTRYIVNKLIQARIRENQAKLNKQIIPKP